MLATTIEAYGVESPEVSSCVRAEISNALPARNGRAVAIILACTHYPLISSQIENEIHCRLKPATLQVIDPGEFLAAALDVRLNKEPASSIEVYINGMDSDRTRSALLECSRFSGIELASIQFGNFEQCFAPNLAPQT
jgi:glutamate racemase